jgi:hypothetical protein
MNMLSIKNFSALTAVFVVAAMMMIQSSDGYIVSAFSTPYSPSCRNRRHGVAAPVVSLSVVSTVMAESDIPASSEPEPDSVLADVTIPTNLPSDCGMDYVPLASMLATGQLEEADQVRK